MIRTFLTHEVRKQVELTESIWEFEPCSGRHAGKKYQVATPCVWESHPDFSDYRGEGIYRKTFHAGGNIRLEFKGVSHTATVYLDGKEIAHHYNAYTAFFVVVRNLKEGFHLLEIKADNRFHEESALHIPNDYMSYGGVSRGVLLEFLNDIYLEHVHVMPYQREGIWHAKIETVLSVVATECFHHKSVVVQGAIMHHEFDWKVEIDTQNRMMLHTDIAFEDVMEWTPENPKLYQVKVQIIDDDVIVDDLIDRFGFREIKIQGKHILLNGKKLRLKGVCRHEDHPAYGCALPYAAICNDLTFIRHLGANTIRTAHYPNDEIFLDLCDELGILVWEENHARGIELEQMMHPRFEMQAENVIKEMISQHYNHPCIYIWGILNECASETEFGRECYKKQFHLIKDLDMSRPHTFASCKFFQDICFDLPDVISCNIYPGWYVDKPVKEYLQEIYGWIREEGSGKGKPFIVSEVGAGALYGCRNNYDGKWTEEYQAKVLKEQLTECLNFKECTGVYVWQFCDIRVSEEWFSTRPREMNNKGIVDEYRRKKLAYGVVKEVFEQYSNYYQ